MVAAVLFYLISSSVLVAGVLSDQKVSEGGDLHLSCRLAAGQVAFSFVFVFVYHLYLYLYLSVGVCICLCICICICFSFVFVPAQNFSDPKLS